MRKPTASVFLAWLDKAFQIPNSVKLSLENNVFVIGERLMMFKLMNISRVSTERLSNILRLGNHKEVSPI